jgi:hypothetical protein
MIQIAERRTKAANKSHGNEIDVIVCTVARRHLLEQISLDQAFYQHRVRQVDPSLLGFECHEVLREHWGSYDYYCYVEDDLIPHDPWFFAKIGWFNRHVGDDKLLQPNRFERGDRARHQKVYIDGDLAAHVTANFQNVHDRPQLGSTILGIRVLFRRALNPHAGCFFLNDAQMRTWIEQPYFLNRDTSFIGPLESAATLGIMQTFKVYKPAIDNAAFLEIEHHGNQFINLIRRSNERPNE